MSSRSSWESKLDAPPIVPLEIFKLTCASVAWQPLLLTSYLSFGFLAYDCPHWCEPFTLFCLPPPPSFYFAVEVSTFLITLIHCMSSQKYRKGVDQFDLYLASGLGTSPDKNPKDTKCKSLVDTVLNNHFSLFFPILLLARKHHLETFESRTATTLEPLFFCCLCQR